MLYINSSYFSNDKNLKSKSSVNHPLFIFHLRRKLIAIISLIYIQICMRMIFTPESHPQNKLVFSLSMIPIVFISILQSRKIPLSHPVSFNKVPITLIKMMKIFYHAYILIFLSIFSLYLSFGCNLICSLALFIFDSTLVYVNNNSTATQVMRYKRPVCSQLGKRNGKLLLGCPIKFKIDAVTGKIKLIQLNYQIISNKAFFKKMKKEIVENKIKYNYWMPLYLGKKKHQIKEKTLHLLTSSLTYFKNSLTTKAKYQTIEQLAVTIFPKIITQIIYQLANNQYTNTYQLFTFLLYFFYQFNMLRQQYPVIQNLMNNRIQNFMDHQEERHKSKLDSLGDILSLHLLSTQYRFDSDIGRTFLEYYLLEQYDRNVYWILQSYPNFEKLDNQSDFQRIQQAFELKIKSYRFVMMAFLLEKNVLIVNQVKNPFQMSSVLLNQYKAVMTQELFDLIRKQFYQIGSINQYKQFYRFLDLIPPSRDEYIAQLKDAVKRSKFKGYHGDGVKADYNDNDVDADILDNNDDDLDDNYLEQNKQIKISPQLESFIKRILQNPQPIVIFNNMRLIYNSIDTITIKDLIKLQEEVSLGKTDKFKLIVQLNYISQRYSKHARLQKFSDILPTFQQCCYRQILWNFLFEFSKNPNFELFYNFTQALGQKSRALDIIILQKYALKSNYYYIQQMFSRFNQINFISLQRYKFLPNNVVPSSLLKFFSRGLENYTKIIQEQHNSDTDYQIKLLVFKDIQFQSDLETQKHFYRILKILQESHKIQVIVLNRVILPTSLIKILSTSMNKMPHVKILGLQNMNMPHDSISNIADSLFMLKNLQFLNLQQCYNLDDSLASLLNNISFLKNLQSVILKDTLANLQHPDDIFENLSKILKIGPSIRYLNLNNSLFLRHLQYLPQKFSQALAENTTLECLKLNMPKNENFDMYSYKLLVCFGYSIAINQQKNGGLKHLSLKNLLQKKVSDQFFKSLKLPVKNQQFQIFLEKSSSQLDLAELTRLLQKLNQSNYFSQFRLPISLISLKMENLNLQNTFELVTTSQDYLSLETLPQFFQLIAQLKKIHLTSISKQTANYFFNSANFLAKSITLRKQELIQLNLRNNNFGAERSLSIVSSLILNQNREIASQLKILDLSGNALSDNGMKFIAKYLNQPNLALQYLNLYNNNITVQGAQYLEQILSENKFDQDNEQFKEGYNQNRISRLERIDLGFNRLRDNGAQKIYKIVLQHFKELKVLNLRYNYISVKGLKKMAAISNRFEHAYSFLFKLSQNPIKLDKECKMEMDSIKEASPDIKFDLQQ